MPVHVLVAADSCTDRTAAVAAGLRRRGRSASRPAASARRARPGWRELLRLTAGSDPAAVWLATTDADTVVPPGWLRRQLAYAGPGLGCRPRHGHRGGLERAPAARAGRVRGPLRLRRPAAPARARREHRHPRLGLPGRGRLPATADRRRSRAARRRARRRLPVLRAATSRSRPPPAGRRARRTASVTCCGRWPRRSSSRAAALSRAGQRCHGTRLPRLPPATPGQESGLTPVASGNRFG